MFIATQEVFNALARGTHSAHRGDVQINANTAIGLVRNNIGHTQSREFQSKFFSPGAYPDAGLCCSFVPSSAETSPIHFRGLNDPESPLGAL